MEEVKKYWYAVQKDTEDNDWGTGSFDYDEAVDMAKARKCEIIAQIDISGDGECVCEYHSGIDF